MSEFVKLDEYYPNRSVVFEVFPLGDIHYGLVICDEEKLDKRIAYIKRHKCARWIGMGEFLDLIVPGDKRYDAQMLAPWVDTIDVAKSQYEYALDKLKPIKDKCWGLLTDNHSESMRIKTNRDTYSDLVRELETKRFGFECFLNVHFHRGKQTPHQGTMKNRTTIVHFWLHHGWFGGRLMGETALNLERLSKSYDADIYLVAHGHKGMIIPLKLMTARWASAYGDRPIEMHRWAMMTQHWLDAHKVGTKVPAWAERRGFWPQPVGAPIIRIKPDVRYVEAVSSGYLTEVDYGVPEDRNDSMQH